MIIKWCGLVSFTVMRGLTVCCQKKFVTHLHWLKSKTVSQQWQFSNPKSYSCWHHRVSVFWLLLFVESCSSSQILIVLSEIRGAAYVNFVLRRIFLLRCYLSRSLQYFSSLHSSVLDVSAPPCFNFAVSTSPTPLSHISSATDSDQTTYCTVEENNFVGFSAGPDLLKLWQ